MMPFDFSRTGTPQSAMADVFEEEEEEDQLSPRTARPHTSHGPARDETAGIGISIVDADSSAMNFGADFGVLLINFTILGMWQISLPMLIKVMAATVVWRRRKLGRWFGSVWLRRPEWLL